MKTKWIGLFLCLILLLMLTGEAGASPDGYAISWSVMAGGGGRAQAGIYILEGAIGQAVTGTQTLGTSSICSGFWCIGVEWLRLYLPLILKMP